MAQEIFKLGYPPPIPPYIYNNEVSKIYENANYVMNIVGYPILEQTELGAVQQPTLTYNTTISVSQ